MSKCNLSCFQPFSFFYNLTRDFWTKDVHINKTHFIKTLQEVITFQTMTYDSWSRLTGLDNQADHHTSKQQGYNDPSHTGRNLGGTSATLKNMQDGNMHPCIIAWYDKNI